MKDISDSAFDDIFRKRVEESNPPFEEGAWNAMEKKLRRRNRLILFRNTSAVLIVCLMLAGSFYFYNRPNDEESLAKQKKEQRELKNIGRTDSVTNMGAIEELIEKKEPQFVKLIPGKKTLKADNRKDFIDVINKTVTHSKPPTSADSSNAVAADISSRNTEVTPSTAQPAATAAEAALAKLEESEQAVKIKKRNPIKFGLALAAGPDFNSTTSIAGNKATLGVGLLLNASLSNKISLSTGIRYGGKIYKTSATSYGITNPELLNAITYVDGSCNVLEIPLRASYELLNNNRKSLKVNGGLSSYMMLKEKYVFKYRPDSYIDDYVIEKRNSNQHYLSVAEISATYRFKTNTSKVEFGIEPYVKIPLGGVGEGKVRLKSSGITLNMFYDLSKKNKQ